MIGLGTIAATAAIVAAVAGNARAERIDIKAATCAQFSDWKPEDRYDVFVFYLGYYGAMTKSAEIDDDALEIFAKKFEVWCAANPEARLLDNIRTVFESR